jgi:hypothetical protein
LSEFRLRGKLYLVWDSCVAPSRQVAGPLFGYVQLTVKERISFGTGISQKHAYLTILDASSGPTVLPFDPGRFTALFQKAGFVDDQNRFWISHML